LCTAQIGIGIGIEIEIPIAIPISISTYPGTLRRGLASHQSL